MSVSMSLMITAAVVATGVAFIFVPRQRRALPFEIVLALGTLIVSTLCAGLGMDAMGTLPILAPLGFLTMAGVPIVPIVLGAVAGAFLVVVPLWWMDRRAEAVESE